MKIATVVLVFAVLFLGTLIWSPPAQADVPGEVLVSAFEVDRAGNPIFGARLTMDGVPVGPGADVTDGLFIQNDGTNAALLTFDSGTQVLLAAGESLAVADIPKARQACICACNGILLEIPETVGCEGHNGEGCVAGGSAGTLQGCKVRWVVG